MADGIPLTRQDVPPDRAERIRGHVRRAERLGTDNDASRLARLDDASGLFALLSDPAVHAPIYTLPRPLTLARVEAFIDQHLAERRAGTGLLFVREDQDGRIMGYSDVQVWPQWAAGELGGALHPSQHAKGQGTRGAVASFDWMFEALDLGLLCETASLSNVPTQRMLDGMGFARRGEIESVRPDGTHRRSLVWEMTRDDWRARWGRLQP
ncbi:MAG: GNAT family N-acetyltransferase [Pseudomonadota bacterium]|nr:GNAT family N-acetyltransferase [Pseudomonadota bacterium]